MSELLLVVGAALLVATLGALVFAVVKRRALKSTLRRLNTERFQGRTCLLIRPCAGDEPRLFDALTSVTQSNRDFSLTVAFGVDCAEDSVIPAIENAVKTLEAAGIEAKVVIAPLIGPNRKASILAECVRRFGQNVDAVISADSNVSLAGFNLNALVEPLFADADLGATWVPFRESCDTPAFGNLVSEAVLHYSWHSFGLLSALDPRGMVGKLFAVKREALRATDDFRNTARVLGEDVALARSLLENGWKVTALPIAVTSPVGRKTCADTVARHVRWMMVVKAQRPALLISYPLLFFNSLPLCLVGVFMLFSHPFAAFALLTSSLITRRRRRA